MIKIERSKPEQDEIARWHIEIHLGWAILALLVIWAIVR